MKVGPVQHTINGDTLQFQVPSVLDYEVIAVDFARDVYRLANWSAKRN